MTITKCDICGKEYKDCYRYIFTIVKKTHILQYSGKQVEEYLDVCDECQENFKVVLDKKAREEE